VPKFSFLRPVCSVERETRLNPEGHETMLKLDDYFQEDAAADQPKHPTLRAWLDYRNRSEVADAKFELHRPRDVLGYKPAKIYVHFYDKDANECHCDHDAWDDDLNAGLVQHGFKAVSEDNEVERFALALRSALRNPENRFGDGFFNSVLVHVVKESEFANYDEIKYVLKHATALDPNLNSRSYTECAEMIKVALCERALELKNQLSYPQDRAKAILVGAVARYLDERFSVTNRARLGWLSG
jgi:hypothetical protein